MKRRFGRPPRADSKGSGGLLDRSVTRRVVLRGAAAGGVGATVAATGVLSLQGRATADAMPTSVTGSSSTLDSAAIRAVNGDRLELVTAKGEAIIVNLGSPDLVAIPPPRPQGARMPGDPAWVERDLSTRNVLGIQPKIDEAFETVRGVAQSWLDVGTRQIYIGDGYFTDDSSNGQYPACPPEALRQGQKIWVHTIFRPEVKADAALAVHKAS
jgi:hypothetical protein